jgi:hypothetical protein
MLVTQLSNKNQFVINADNGDLFFQSYESIVCKKSKGKIYLDSVYWDYSKTTSKHRSIFLNEKTKETQAKINSGEYILCNLN